MQQGRRTVVIRSISDDTCAICLNNMFNKTVTHLRCGHTLHLKCFRRLTGSSLSSKQKCPICRAPYEDTAPSTLDDVLEMITRAADDRAIFDVLSDPAVEMILNRSGIQP